MQTHKTLLIKAGIMPPFFLDFLGDGSIGYSLCVVICYLPISGIFRIFSVFHPPNLSYFARKKVHC